MKACMSVWFSGVGQSRTLATLTGSISTLFSKMTSLRYSICFQWNSHFSGQRNNLYSTSTSKTLQTAHSCSSSIFQVHHYDPLSYESSEDVIHHSLKGSRTIGHFEEHHKGFKKAVISTEGRLPFISGLDAYVIEILVDV